MLAAASSGNDIYDSKQEPWPLPRKCLCYAEKITESGSQDLKSHAGPPYQKTQHAQKRFLFTWNCTNQY